MNRTDDAADGAEKFFSSLHRSLLGCVLALVGLAGLGLVMQGESLLSSIAGIVVVSTAGCWIGYLFIDGLRER